MTTNDEQDTQDQAEEFTEETTAPLPPVMYEVRSMVRSRHTRSLRASTAMTNRHRFKQHVLTDQRRLIRNRPLVITELELYQNLPELKQKHSLGILEVRTRAGALVNLDTLQVGALPPAPPAPIVILDSVANDTPVGYTIPRNLGDTPLAPEKVKDIIHSMGEDEIDEDARVTEPLGTAVMQELAKSTLEQAATDIPPPPPLTEMGMQPPPDDALPPGWVPPGIDPVSPADSDAAADAEDEEAEHQDKTASSSSSKKKDKKKR